MIWLSVLLFLLGVPPLAPAFPISSAAWSNSVWQDHCKEVRTSYNPKHALDSDRLTLTPKDPRFSDFLYWIWANKILEHQVEQIGGTEWTGPTDGVILTFPRSLHQS